MRTIPEILKSAKTVAVVGLSPKPDRPSLEVATFLQARGHRIVPINPAYAGDAILGETVYASLPEAARALGGTHIDVVDCFRKSDDIPPIARDAIAIHAGALWMQLGIENADAAAMARAAGLDVVENHCMLIETRKMEQAA